MGKNKIENKKAVEHCLDVTNMMQFEADADHDAVMFMHVAREPKDSMREGMKEQMELNSYVHGCPCTIQQGVLAMMEQSKSFAHAVIRAVTEWQGKHDPMHILAKIIAKGVIQHVKDEDKAHKNSSDASKN